MKLTILKRTRVILLSFLFFISMVQGQVNHVPNPSFEILAGFNPSFAVNSISVAIPWDSLKAGGGGGGIIPSPTINFSGLTLYQTARTGSFMAAINYYNSTSKLNWRSYIQAPLIYKLKKNKSYCVTSYFNLINRCQYACDELSIYFDDGTIQSIAPGQVALANPQIKSPSGVFFSDTLNWMKVQGTFIANGNESYITFGNFKPQSSLTATLVYPSAQGVVADYYLDDVSVIEVDLPAFAGRDTVLCTGDSLFIGRPPEIGLECLWFNNSVQIATGGGLWVKPTSTQTFMVQQDVCGLIKTDTIKVQVKPKYTGSPQLVSNVTSACMTDTIKLSVQNEPPGSNIKYVWEPKAAYTSTTNLNAISLIRKNTLFTHTITSKGEDNFCPFVRTNSLSIDVPDTCFKDPEIPNVFTPNNDNVNDVWSIKFPYGFSLEGLSVYDRWGTILYEQNNLSFKLQSFASIGWDGRTTSGLECSSGVYFYVLTYINKNGEQKTVKGNLSLIR